MIIYQATKSGFLDDSFKRDIETVLADSYLRRTGGTVSASEMRAWKESLQQMAKVLNDDEIPGDSGVAIEYKIPQASKRIDFILTGMSEGQSPNVIIVELKQWSESKRTDKDGIILARRGGRAGDTEGPHPSYQAWSYAALLEGFNEAVYDGGMALKPCAYLHNYESDNVIDHEWYAPYIEKAPLFLKGEAERARLRTFIKQHVKYGDHKNLIVQIENGRIRPSKMLADSLAKMLKGNHEFVLIDDQKVVYETALAAARAATPMDKRVVLVKGGPGTGKSVVAINLLVELTKLGLLCKYVSKNAAPRAVYEVKLKGAKSKTEISNLFSGSGAFTEAEPNTFDALIVDEAHRLNEKSGLYANLGENQIKELLSAAKCAVVFVDDDQQVTLLDIGHSEEIRKWAAGLDATIVELELASQFRCSGSDGYLAWLDNTLGIRPTANEMLGTGEFDFRVLNSPQAVHDLITEKNRANNKSRVVAGYCWEWPSKKQRTAFDIEVPEHGYRKRWNVTDGPSPWIIGPGSVEEVGCIHTCQGLELDYVGVIVGPDLVVRNGAIVCQPEKRARSDRSIRGYKAVLKDDPAAGKARLDRIIKNTYRTLMTRGMKGCYVYCTDPETAEYFRSRLAAPAAAPAPARAQVLPFRAVKHDEVKPYVNALPVIDLKFAAGAFGDGQVFDPSDAEWVAVPEGVKAEPGLFIAQVVGESMNRRIPNGAWCVFRVNPAGSRQGKVVVAQHRSIHDMDLGGSYTVKVYESDKKADGEGEWHHARITLKPDTSAPGYQPTVIEGEELGSLEIVAEFIRVVG